MFLFFFHISRSPCIIPAAVPITDHLRPRGETSQISLYILCCCSIGYVVAQVAGHVQDTPSSGLCFAEVLIHFLCGKFQALDMSYFSKGHAGFFREFWHDLCQKM